MADALSTRNADESERLSTQRAQRTQRVRNDRVFFRRLRENKSVKIVDCLRESGGNAGRLESAPRQMRTLLEVENIDDDFCVAIS